MPRKSKPPLGTFSYSLKLVDRPGKVECKGSQTTYYANGLFNFEGFYLSFRTTVIRDRTTVEDRSPEHEDKKIKTGFCILHNTGESITTP